MRNETHTAKFKSAAILALACFYGNGAIHSHVRARGLSMRTHLTAVENQSLSSEICLGTSHEIGRSLYQSFFSKTGLENSREIPGKSAVFSAKFDFFSRDLPEALLDVSNFNSYCVNQLMIMLQFSLKYVFSL